MLGEGRQVRDELAVEAFDLGGGVVFECAELDCETDTREVGVQVRPTIDTTLGDLHLRFRCSRDGREAGPRTTFVEASANGAQQAVAPRTTAGLGAQSGPPRGANAVTPTCGMVRAAPIAGRCSGGELARSRPRPYAAPSARALLKSRPATQ